MGLTQTKPTISDEIAPFLPYMCGVRSESLTVDPAVTLIVKQSRLPSAFLEGVHNGVFTKTPLTKGTIICLADTDISHKMNDPMVDLEPLLRATNSQQCYNAWVSMKKQYYDLEKTKEVVNVRMVSDDKTVAFETLCDVPADTELVRMYGFTTWTMELFDILSNKTIAGFTKFILELDGNVSADPYEAKISNLHKALNAIVPDNETISLEEYDLKQESVPFEYVGEKVKAAYVLVCNA